MGILPSLCVSPAEKLNVVEVRTEKKIQLSWALLKKALTVFTVFASFSKTK